MKEYQGITEAMSLLKAISNEKRLLILCKLSNTELSVSQIADGINLSQSALSQHLAVLREKGLVSTRREHQAIYYSISCPEVTDIIQVLHKHFCKC